MRSRTVGNMIAILTNYSKSVIIDLHNSSNSTLNNLAQIGRVISSNGTEEVPLFVNNSACNEINNIVHLTVQIEHSKFPTLLGTNKETIFILHEIFNSYVGTILLKVLSRNRVYLNSKMFLMNSLCCTIDRIIPFNSNKIKSFEHLTHILAKWDARNDMRYRRSIDGLFYKDYIYRKTEQAYFLSPLLVDLFITEQ